LLFEFRINLVGEHWFQGLYQTGQRKLGTKNEAGIFRGPAPAKDVEFVFDETREHAIVGSTDELTKFRVGSGNFGENLGLLLTAFGLQVAALWRNAAVEGQL